MIISILILLICTYVFLESLSVATESRGLEAYIDSLVQRSNVYDGDCGLTIFNKVCKQFSKECSPFCQVIRYLLNAAASLVVAYYPMHYIKTFILNKYFSLTLPYPDYSPWLLLIAFTLMFNVWGRMVYRIVGDRRNLQAV